MPIASNPRSAPGALMPLVAAHPDPLDRRSPRPALASLLSLRNPGHAVDTQPPGNLPPTGASSARRLALFGTITMAFTANVETTLNKTKGNLDPQIGFA